MSSMGSLELLNETSLSSDQQELVNTIQSSISILLLLIEDILQFVKIEHYLENPIDITKQAFSLNKCLKSLANIIGGYSSQAGVVVEINICERSKALVIESNQSRLHQILSNLLTNAVKASKRGETVELNCTYHEEGSFCLFEVKDYGCGIPKSKIQSIFEPFVQLHNVNESIFPR